MVRVVKLFQTFTHKLEIFIVLYQFPIIFYQIIEKVAITLCYLYILSIFNTLDLLFPSNLSQISNSELDSILLVIA